MILTPGQMAKKTQLQIYKQSRTRWMSQEEQDMLDRILESEAHGRCPRTDCTGYQGLIGETKCPNCGSTLHQSKYLTL